MCKYNNYKFWGLTFFEGINKYSLRKLTANELAVVFLVDNEIMTNIYYSSQIVLVDADL